jgi:predicted MFS family arabinose efflux permease
MMDHGKPDTPGTHGLMSAITLALGTLAVGTDVFIVAGFLPAMAESLEVSAANAGQSVTVFAMTFAILAPVLAAVTARIPRRLLLVGSLLILCLANVGTALSPVLPVLLATRVLAAIGAAMYTPGATAVSAVHVRPEQRARALAMVGSGLALSTAVGVPLGALISGWMGWRTALLMLAAAFLVVAAILYFLLPGLPPNQPIGLKARLAVLRRSNAALVLPLTVLGMAASYLPYTYSAPALRVLGVAEAGLPAILFLYGAGSISGNLVTGVATDRYGPVPVLRVCYAVMSLSLAAIWFIGVTDAASIVAAGAASFFWGASTWMQTPAQQQRLITAAPSEGPLLMALQSSAIYVGIGLGTAVGSWVIADLPRSAFGIAAIVAALAFIYLEITAEVAEGWLA